VLGLARSPPGAPSKPNRVGRRKFSVETTSLTVSLITITFGAPHMQCSRHEENVSRCAVGCRHNCADQSVPAAPRPRGMAGAAAVLAGALADRRTAQQPVASAAGTFGEPVQGDALRSLRHGSQRCVSACIASTLTIAVPVAVRLQRLRTTQPNCTIGCGAQSGGVCCLAGAFVPFGAGRRNCIGTGDDRDVHMVMRQ
jgi:hypothetical protein